MEPKQDTIPDNIIITVTWSIALILILAAIKLPVHQRFVLSLGMGIFTAVISLTALVGIPRCTACREN